MVIFVMQLNVFKIKFLMSGFLVSSMILVIFQCAPNFDYSEIKKYTFYPLSAVLAEHYYSPLTCSELLTVPHQQHHSDNLESCKCDKI